MTTKRKKTAVFSINDYNSGDGMVTTVWGPAIWHFIHTMSFNYPANPSLTQKKQYMSFIYSLQNILPCGKCRENLKKNMEKMPLNMENMKSRATFSKYIYLLHEHVNKMLGKTSGLSYKEVRERYEHFRSRCSLANSTPVAITPPPISLKSKTKKRRENGCTEPLYGEKAKCVLKIVPEKTKCKSLVIDKNTKKHY